MQDQEETGGPLWTCGEMILKVQRAARASDRIVHVRRPFARVGQASGGEITIGAAALTTSMFTFTSTLVASTPST